MSNQGNAILNAAKIQAMDVMSVPVTTVHVWDSIHDVAKIFIENNISSAAVVDMENIPMGVITKTDLARYDRERATLVVAEQDTKAFHAKKGAEGIARDGFHVEPEEATLQSWMTPFVFDVHPSTLFAAVVKKMVRNGLHHIFVTNRETKKIVGVITTFDVLIVMNRLLNPETNDATAKV
jgi:CBS domain-containing protein